MTMKPMTPMTMAMSSMLTFRKRKGKNCCVEDVRHNKKFKCYAKSENDCFGNDSDNCCYWNNNDCSRNKLSNGVSFKMMLMLEWSELREGNNNLNDKLLKLTFSKGNNNNNKPNRWKRMQKKMQIRFLCPWSNQILNPLVTANNNKRSKSVHVMEVLLGDVGEEISHRHWTHTTRI